MHAKEHPTDYSPIQEAMDTVEAEATPSEWVHLVKKYGLCGEEEMSLAALAQEADVSLMEMQRRDRAVMRIITWKVKHKPAEETPQLLVKSTPLPDRTGLSPSDPIPSFRRGIFASETVPANCVTVEFRGEDRIHTVATQFSLEELDHIVRAHDAFFNPAFREIALNTSSLRALIYHTDSIPWGHRLSNRAEALASMQKLDDMLFTQDRYIKQMGRFYPIVTQTIATVKTNIEPFLPKIPQ